MIDTKEKLLNTAERLFGDYGFGATSLRQIIAEAGVNLASVHYHFGSKEDLLDAVVLRKLAPINAERLRLLDKARSAAGNEPVTTEAYLDAFLRPAVMQAGEDPSFCKLMGRLHGEGLMPHVIAKNFQEIGARFIGGLRMSLPGLTNEEAAWRIHFMVGAMAQTLKGPPEYPGISANPLAPEALLACLIAFLSAGFRAPATPRMEATEVKA